MAQNVCNVFKFQWTPSSETMRFVVGVKENDGGLQVFEVHRDIFIEISPVVAAAISGEFKEKGTGEICLPQFEPPVFELFLRFAQSVALSQPPEINLPVVNDELVIQIVPIAAYLGAEQMLEVLKARVQAKATVATVKIFERCSVSVTWGDQAFEAIFSELTVTRSENLYVKEKKGQVNNILDHGPARYIEGGQFKAAPVINTKLFVLDESKMEPLQGFSPATLCSFLKFIVNNHQYRELPFF